MRTRTRPDTTDQPNPDLPAGYDDEDSPFYVHPDLRPHWGLDVEKEYELLGDSKQLEVWVRHSATLAEYRRLVADGTLPAGLDLESYRAVETRVERTGWRAPAPGPEDRPGYAHAVRSGFAHERAEQAERQRQQEAARAQAEWCVIGGHRDPTTELRDLYVGRLRERMCLSCQLVAQAQVAGVLAAQDLDGTPRGERVAAWLSSTDTTVLEEPNRLAGLHRMITTGHALAAGHVRLP